VRTNPANDIVDIEGVVGFVEHNLVVNTDDKDAVVAHHQRNPIELVGELPADHFLNGECAVKKATRDTVFNLNRRHTGETNGGCKSCRMRLQKLSDAVAKAVGCW
jgi:hypothetical protein